MKFSIGSPSDKRAKVSIPTSIPNLELLTYLFKQNGFEITACNSLENCLPLIYENDFTAIILDNWFRGGTSLEVCRKIRSFNPAIPIIYYSAEAREKEIEKALEAGANVYLTKPDNFDKLIETIAAY